MRLSSILLFGWAIATNAGDGNSTESGQALAVSTPPYIKASGIFYTTFWTITYAGIALFSLYKSEMFLKAQQLLMASCSCYMFAEHLILKYFEKLPVVGSLAYYSLVLLVLAVGVLSLNFKFRRLFGSIGCGYIIGYEIALILKISFSVFIITIMVAMGGLIFLSRTYEAVFASLQKGFVCPFLLLVAVNLLFGAPIASMHDPKGSTVLSVLGKIFLVLSTVFAFTYLLFTDKVVAKYGEYKAKLVESAANKSEDQENV